MAIYGFIYGFGKVIYIKYVLQGPMRCPKIKTNLKKLFNMSLFEKLHICIPINIF